MERELDATAKDLLDTLYAEEEAAALQPGEFTIDHYAKHFGITRSKAETALNRLVREGRLEQRQGYVRHRGRDVLAYREPSDGTKTNLQPKN